VLEYGVCSDCSLLNLYAIVQQEPVTLASRECYGASKRHWTSTSLLGAVMNINPPVSDRLP